jgi:uncharacterized protein YbjT (DUF2867 family)
MFVVTGSTSNTGTAVANSFLHRGVPVRVIGRSSERLEPFINRGAEPVVSEPSDRLSLAKAFRGRYGCLCDASAGLYSRKHQLSGISTSSDRRHRPGSH